jgi:hypothetical protein
VGGDAGAHSAGAEDGDSSDECHGLAYLTLPVGERGGLV